MILKGFFRVAFSHSVDHTNGVSFHVKTRIGSSVSARSGRDLDMYGVIPQRCLTLATFTDCGMSRIACTLASLPFTPSFVIL